VHYTSLTTHAYKIIYLPLICSNITTLNSSPWSQKYTCPCIHAHSNLQKITYTHMHSYNITQSWQLMHVYSNTLVFVLIAKHNWVHVAIKFSYHIAMYVTFYIAKHLYTHNNTLALLINHMNTCTITLAIASLQI